MKRTKFIYASTDYLKGVANKETKYFVYRNLHKSCWSLKNTKTGRVDFHASQVFLKGCAFKVSEAGRQRVIKTGRKNVHAGVTGYLTSWEEIQAYRTYGYDFEKRNSQRAWLEANYKPYTSGNFNTHLGEPIKSATYVHLGVSKPFALL